MYYIYKLGSTYLYIIRTDRTMFIYSYINSREFMKNAADFSQGREATHSNFLYREIPCYNALTHEHGIK